MIVERFKIFSKLILVILLFSCQKREWNNPFDPDCPKELYTPTNFSATLVSNSVKLSWTQTDIDISGYVIERSVAGGIWTSIAAPDKSATTWADTNITGGKIHVYHIVAKAGTNLSNQLTTQITPLIASTIEIQYANIPAGTFIMGSPITEGERGNDEIQHQVTLSAFKMSKYEITNNQYADFLNSKGIGSNGRYAAGMYPNQDLITASTNSLDFGLLYINGQWIPVSGCEDHPVNNVTWYGASEFATYNGGRLPTEAEWEYACRAGTSTPFHTGSCLSNTLAIYLWSSPYGSCTVTDTTTPYPWKAQAVGTYPANAWGLYDMHGNVWEWCADWSGNYLTSAQTNPTGPLTGTYRIERGGCYDIWAYRCRSAGRHRDSPDYRHRATGFRIVLL